MACVSDYAIIHFPQISFYRKPWKIPKELTESFNHNRFLFNMAGSGRGIFSHVSALLASLEVAEDAGDSAPRRVGPGSTDPGGSMLM